MVPGETAGTRAASVAQIRKTQTGTVSVIDTAKNAVTATIPVGAGAWGVAVSPDGARVYVTSIDSNTLSVINAATNVVTATADVGHRPAGVAVSPDGARLYVTNAGSDAVSGIVRSACGEAEYVVTASVDVGASIVDGAAVSPDGRHVYVA